MSKIELKVIKQIKLPKYISVEFQNFYDAEYRIATGQLKNLQNLEGYSDEDFLNKIIKRYKLLTKILKHDDLENTWEKLIRKIRKTYNKNQEAISSCVLSLLNEILNIPDNYHKFTTQVKPLDMKNDIIEAKKIGEKLNKKITKSLIHKNSMDCSLKTILEIFADHTDDPYKRSFISQLLKMWPHKSDYPNFSEILEDYLYWFFKYSWSEYYDIKDHTQKRFKL